MTFTGRQLWTSLYKPEPQPASRRACDYRLPLGHSLVRYRYEIDKSDNRSDGAPTGKTDNDKTDNTIQSQAAQAGAAGMVLVIHQNVNPKTCSLTTISQNPETRNPKSQT